MRTALQALHWESKTPDLTCTRSWTSLRQTCVGRGRATASHSVAPYTSTSGRFRPIRPPLWRGDFHSRLSTGPRIDPGCPSPRHVLLYCVGALLRCRLAKRLPLPLVQGVRGVLVVDRRAPITPPCAF